MCYQILYDTIWSLQFLRFGFLKQVVLNDGSVFSYTGNELYSQLSLNSNAMVNFAPFACQRCQSSTIATTRFIIDQYRDGPPVTILQEHIMKLNDSLRKAQSILIYIGTALWWKYYMRTQWRLTTRFAEALAAILHDGVRVCLRVFSLLNVVVIEKSDSSYHLVCRRCKPWLILLTHATSFLTRAMTMSGKIENKVRF